MRFTIGGMGLSGSTLCYNIFRLTSELKKYPKPLKIHSWDFVANNDMTTYKSLWIFNVTDDNTGMISNGEVNYDILSYSRVDDAAYLKVYNTKVRRNMEIVIKKTEYGLGVVVFDSEQRTSYYFFP